MALSRNAPNPRSPQAADVASGIIELLEVLWEHGRDAVSPAPVSTSQLRVLYTLDREEGINQRSLGEVLGAAPSSVSRLCDRLQALGFVERSPSPVSRRELELRLTPQGRAYLQDLRARREDILQSAIAAMPATTRQALSDGLTGFRHALETASPSRHRTGTAPTAGPTACRPDRDRCPASPSGTAPGPGGIPARCGRRAAPYSAGSTPARSSPYVYASSSACQDAAITFSATPTVDHSAVPSPVVISTRVVESVPCLPSRMRTL